MKIWIRWELNLEYGGYVPTLVTHDWGIAEQMKHVDMYTSKRCTEHEVQVPVMSAEGLGDIYNRMKQIADTHKECLDYLAEGPTGEHIPEEK